jgi:hypothetical protein
VRAILTSKLFIWILTSLIYETVSGFLLAHLADVIIGVGGATMSDAVFFKTIKIEALAEMTSSF